MELTEAKHEERLLVLEIVLVVVLVVDVVQFNTNSRRISIISRITNTVA